MIVVGVDTQLAVAALSPGVDRAVALERQAVVIAGSHIH